MVETWGAGHILSLVNGYISVKPFPMLYRKRGRSGSFYGYIKYYKIHHSISTKFTTYILQNSPLTIDLVFKMSIITACIEEI